MANPAPSLGIALSAILRRLSFENNFECREVDVTIPAASEVSVRNPFRGGRVPSHYLIVSQTGGGNIRKGPTAWDANYLYFKNHHAVDSTSGTIKVFL